MERELASWVPLPCLGLSGSWVPLLRAGSGGPEIMGTFKSGERGLKYHCYCCSSLGREQLEPHIGHPSPGVQHQEDESPWLVGGPVGITGGQSEAWILLAGSQNRARGWI